MSAVTEASTTLDADLLDPPDFDWDPWALGNMLDPYPMHHALRELAPVVWLPKYEAYAVARHEETRQVMTDYSRFMTGAGTSYQDIRKPGKFRIPSRLQEVDPPKHTQIRGVVTRAMSPLVIRRMRGFFEERAERVAADLVGKGQFDGVNDLAISYVISAFPDAVGVKLEREAALAIAEMRFNQSCPHNELYDPAMKGAEPYMEWYDAACQRDAVVPGSIADLLFEAEERGELEEGVASNIVRSFVGGGVDSTFSAISHTLHRLALNPDAFQAVKADPKKTRNAFEEAIRMDHPFQYSWRTTTGDTHLSGYRLKGDTKVTMFMGAANRDPRKWENPERYDINRVVVGEYLGFGMADHQCAGQMIARMEADSILTALVRRIKSMELTATATIRPVSQMRMLGTLPLRVVAE
ncbi:cytochrome P450 [Ruixingdingia sedimenti]|uniref:Cytochrome P450 n=1 Tax=Ruixingdingia sedimenti TaxID=3073604 RepID=A0ABU1F3G2_9RHOB|nr:cytochrome P450 [Xinfangfangia sp. LG-4]MDR5651188.1 cytochrome P450 [Xinfangfangia sp. LG-4]